MKRSVQAELQTVAITGSEAKRAITGKNRWRSLNEDPCSL